MYEVRVQYLLCCTYNGRLRVPMTLPRISNPEVHTASHVVVV